MYRIKLANVMGMDMDNAQNGVGIADALIGIVDIPDFIEYCRSNKDGITYSNRIEKLDALATRYKNTINDIPIGLLQEFSKGISDKFKEAIQVIRDNEETFTQRGLEGLKVDGIQWFTNKELELLNAIGGLNRAINLNDLGTLYDSLYDVSVKKTLATKKYNALTDNQKRVKKLVGGLK